MIFISLFLTLLLQFASCSDTTCAENQQHFAEICFTPKAYTALDFKWFSENQPEDGYHLVVSNDVSRLHFAEVLQGKLLTLQDDFTNSCFRTKFQVGAEGIEANVTGFGGLTGSWECRQSKDHMGVNLCDATTSGPSKFHENLNVYTVYTDNKNFLLVAYCYPHGEAGWSVSAITPTLTEEEMKIIEEKVKELGFPYEGLVTTYGDSCPK